MFCPDAPSCTLLLWCSEATFGWGKLCAYERRCSFIHTHGNSTSILWKTGIRRFGPIWLQVGDIYAVDIVTDGFLSSSFFFICLPVFNKVRSKTLIYLVVNLGNRIAKSRKNIIFCLNSLETEGPAAVVIPLVVSTSSTDFQVERCQGWDGPVHGILVTWVGSLLTCELVCKTSLVHFKWGITTGPALHFERARTQKSEREKTMSFEPCRTAQIKMAMWDWCYRGVGCVGLRSGSFCWIASFKRCESCAFKRTRIAWPKSRGSHLTWILSQNHLKVTLPKIYWETSDTTS